MRIICINKRSGHRGYVCQKTGSALPFRKKEAFQVCFKLGNGSKVLKQALMLSSLTDADNVMSALEFAHGRNWSFKMVKIRNR